MENLPNGAKVKSLYKAVKLLDFFDSNHHERGISELAELSGMLKSSVHNIMRTYEECGIIEKNFKTSKYRLGLKILALSNVLSQDDVFWQVIRPFIQELANKTGETVFLATPYGTKIIYRDVAYPNGSISSRSIKGVVAPMYCTSLGKVILAYQDEEMIKQVIEENFESFTANTIVDKEAFLEELKLVKKQGYAIDNMEHEYGIKCIGVPIKNSNDDIIGAISISGPSLRFSDDKFQEYNHLLTDIVKLIKNRI